MSKKKYKLKIGVLGIVMNILYLIYCFLFVEKHKLFLILQNSKVQNLEIDQKWRQFGVRLDIVESLYYLGGIVILLILISEFRKKKITAYKLYKTIVIIYTCCSVLAIPLLVKTYSIITCLFPVTFSMVAILICSTLYLGARHLLKTYSY